MRGSGEAADRGLLRKAREIIEGEEEVGIFSDGCERAFGCQALRFKDPILVSSCVLVANGNVTERR